MIVATLQLQCAADLPAGGRRRSSVLRVHGRLSADAHHADIFVDDLPMERHELEADNGKWCRDDDEENCAESQVVLARSMIIDITFIRSR